MGKIIMIDYGGKRIGIATSDANKIMALPLTTVEGGKNGVANVCKALTSRKKEIEQIIVGNPLLLSGEKSEMSKEVEVFAKALEKEMGLPVHLYDERLSSKGADASLREISLNRKRRSERIDEVAATLLLQSYLDASDTR